MKTIPTVGTVVLEKERVLLIVKNNHPQRRYQLPGGQIEDGETEAEAASRELTETTGLVSESRKFVRIPQQWKAKISKDYGEAVFIFTCFLCQEYSGSIQRTVTATPEWIPLAQLSHLSLNPNTQNAITAALELLERQSDQSDKMS